MNIYKKTLASSKSMPIDTQHVLYSMLKRGMLNLSRSNLPQ
jgi:hypothetical protein